MRIFYEIDNFFKEREKKDFFYILLAIISLIVFVIYYYIYPNVKNYKITEEKRNKDLLSKYQNIKTLINVDNIKISNLQKEINNLKAKLVNLQKERSFFEQLENLLDFAEFDQYKWAQIVKNSVEDAKNKKLKVLFVKNKIFDINKSNGISKRMDIFLTLKGDYKQFIYYIYEYENKKELIRIEEVNITSPLDFCVKFSVYGYKR